MESQQIKELNQELSVRGLKATVKNIIRVKRPDCSEDTFARAWKVSSWERATPLLREILTTGKDILDKDNVRIATVGQEFEMSAN